MIYKGILPKFLRRLKFTWLKEKDQVVRKQDSKKLCECVKEKKALHSDLALRKD